MRVSPQTTDVPPGVTAMLTPKSGPLTAGFVQ